MLQLAQARKRMTNIKDFFSHNSARSKVIIAHFIAKVLRPYSVVDGCHDIINTLEPRYKIPSSLPTNACRSYITKLRKKLKKNYLMQNELH